MLRFIDRDIITQFLRVWRTRRSVHPGDWIAAWGSYRLAPAAADLIRITRVILRPYRPNRGDRRACWGSSLTAWSSTGANSGVDDDLALIERNREGMTFLWILLAVLHVACWGLLRPGNVPQGALLAVLDRVRSPVPVDHRGLHGHDRTRRRTRRWCCVGARSHNQHRKRAAPKGWTMTSAAKVISGYGRWHRPWVVT